MAKIGSLIADLGMNTAKFEAGIKRSKNSTGSFKRKATKDFKAVRTSANNLNGAIGSLTSAFIALLGIGAMTRLTKESLALVDAQAKLADTLGLTISELAGFELAGQRTGATVQQVKKSFEKLAVNVAEAASGTGTAIDAFTKLGLSAQVLVKLPLAEQFKQVAQAMKNVENPTVRVGIAYDIFGRQGTNMIKMLQLSRTELEQFEKRAIALGVALSRVEATQIENANDAMLEASKAVEGFGNILALKFAPFIEDVAIQFSGAAVEAKGFRSEVDKLIDTFVIFAGGIANGMAIIQAGLHKSAQGLLELAAITTDVVANMIFRFRQLSHWLHKELLGVVNIIGDGFAQFFKDVSRGIEAFGNVFGVAAHNIGGLWIDAMAGMRDGFADFLMTVKEGLETAGLSKLANEVGAVVTSLNAVSQKQREAWAASEPEQYFSGISDGLDSWADGLLAINEIRKNTLDGMKAPEFENLEIPAYFLDEAMKQKDAFDAIWTAPIPSEALREWVESLRNASVMAKEKIAEIAPAKGMFDSMIESVNEIGTKFDNVFDRMDEGFKGMKDAFLNNIKKMLQDQLMAQLSKVFTGGMFSSGGGGLFSKLLGFANGGSFEVGGSGGTDSNLVAFRATKGETVSIDNGKGGGSGGGGGGGVTFINSYDFRGSSLDENQVRSMITQSQKVTESQIHNKMRRGRF